MNQLTLKKVTLKLQWIYMIKMYYMYIDCPNGHGPMTPNEELGIWECTCNAIVEDRLPVRTLNKWERYEAKTSISLFADLRQEVTLRCPAGCGQFISTKWDGCHGCSFKWGDEVR